MKHEKENKQTTEITIRPPTEVAAFAEVDAQLHRLDEIYRELMTLDTDYGVIPGTKKPTLYKAGAELLRIWGGLIPRFSIENENDLERGFYDYSVNCELYVQRIIDGAMQEIYVGEGVGSCSSRESRYRWRWVYENQLPPDIDKESLPKKKMSAKTGGGFTLYRVDNENIFDVGNTVLKIAKKRAFVDAILTVTGASRIFSQDLSQEDEMENEPQSFKSTKPTVQIPQSKTIRVSTEQRMIMEQIKSVAESIGVDPKQELKERFDGLIPEVEVLKDWLGDLQLRAKAAAKLQQGDNE